MRSIKKISPVNETEKGRVHRSKKRETLLSLALTPHGPQPVQSHVRFILSVPPARNIPVNHIHHLARISIIRQPLPVIHAQDFHPFVIHQVRQQFGGDQEILRALGFAGHIDH
jgi:hypothetical protein